MIQVKVKAVIKDPEDNHIVLLENDESQKSLPVWVGEPEAYAIASGMKEELPSRPLSHDLISLFLGACNATLQCQLSGLLC